MTLVEVEMSEEYRTEKVRDEVDKIMGRGTASGESDDADRRPELRPGTV